MSATGSYVNDVDEITKVMQAYIDGARTGKGAAMKPAFHDDATIFGSTCTPDRSKRDLLHSLLNRSTGAAPEQRE